MISTFLLAIPCKLFAQDPALPPTNLGLANVYDGIAGKPGFVYVNYVQIYNTTKLFGPTGSQIQSDLKVNSLLSMNQLIYLTPVKLLGGNLGFTVLMPIVKISSTNLTAPAPGVNPALLGDMVLGAAVQWSDRKLFGKPFSHRMEVDVNLPTGAYKDIYLINPSSRMYSYGLYHAFTWILDDKISVSARNQFNYNGRILNQNQRVGAFYNGNYSLDYSFLKRFKIEAAVYYLTQFNEDQVDGDGNFYAKNYGLQSTKERIVGLGGGLAYFAPNGVLIEAKLFFETAARNHSQGNRPTLRLAIPLQ